MKDITCFTLGTLLKLICISIIFAACNSEPNGLIEGKPEDIAFDKNNRMHILFSNKVKSTDTTTDVFYTSLYKNKYDSVYNLSKSSLNSSFAKLYIDNYSTVHAIWIDNCLRVDCPEYLYHNYFRNNKWGKPLNFDGGDIDEEGYSHHYHFGNISGNSTGEMFLFYNRRFITYFINNETTKPQWFKVGTFYPDIVIDDENHLHLVLVSGNEKIKETLTNMDILYYNLSIKDSIWTGPNIVYSNEKTTCNSPRILVGTDHTIHIFWLEDYDRNFTSDFLCHCYSKDGISWSDPVIINTATAKNIIVSMDVAISPDNRLYAVWSERVIKNKTEMPGAVSYSVLSDNEWATPKEIYMKGVKNLSNPCIASDKKGKVHVLVNGKNNDNELGYIYHNVIKD